MNFTECQEPFSQSNLEKKKKIVSTFGCLPSSHVHVFNDSIVQHLWIWKSNVMWIPSCAIEKVNEPFYQKESNSLSRYGQNFRPVAVSLSASGFTQSKISSDIFQTTLAEEFFFFLVQDYITFMKYVVPKRTKGHIHMFMYV